MPFSIMIILCKSSCVTWHLHGARRGLQGLARVAKREQQQASRRVLITTVTYPATAFLAMSHPHDVELSSEPPPYSAFSKAAKRGIGFAASFAAMFSGLSSFIYYPALQPLATDLGVSLELVNLTITSYLVVAGLAPSVIGDMADHTGRRPVYLATFTIYLAANIGLAVQRSYAALLVLRMVQSVGACGKSIVLFTFPQLTFYQALLQLRTVSLAISLHLPSEAPTSAFLWVCTIIAFLSHLRRSF